MTDSKIIDLSKVQTEKYKKDMMNRLADKVVEIDKRRDEIDDKIFNAGLQLIEKRAFGKNDEARRCAMFLLSLWDGKTFKVDLQDLLWVDPDVFDAMLYVLNALFFRNYQLGSVFPEEVINQIRERWEDDLEN